MSTLNRYALCGRHEDRLCVLRNYQTCQSCSGLLRLIWMCCAMVSAVVAA
ncbi:TPA: hypothetical protein JZ953_002330 [Escherichia coli]|nr:hypothetical protein [Escherichia coli]HAY4545190.1 hypothetical protein [Escherichia coli]